MTRPFARFNLAIALALAASIPTFAQQVAISGVVGEVGGPGSPGALAGPSAVIPKVVPVCYAPAALGGPTVPAGSTITLSAICMTHVDSFAWFGSPAPSNTAWLPGGTTVPGSKVTVTLPAPGVYSFATTATNSLGTSPMGPVLTITVY